MTVRRDRTAEIVRERFGGEAKVTLNQRSQRRQGQGLECRIRARQGRRRRGARPPTRNSTAIRFSRLVRWFADQGRRRGRQRQGRQSVNMITRWQALEYIVAQNLERRALAGAGHAHRGARRGGSLAARALAEIGGFPVDTLPRTRI